MALRRACLLSVAFVSIPGINAAFTLYPSMDAKAFGTALGINGDCLAALNATINCDQSTFLMAADVDSYQWDQDDLTALCTSECTDAAKKWNDDVVSKCDSQQINVNGALVPVDTVAGRYTEGLGVACLKSSSSSFCMLESQEWVGSDVIQPDCSNSTDSANSSCGSNSTDHSRMANLYDDDTLCSDCFLKLMYQRLVSPYLPDADHSDYLVEQFHDIQDVCTTSMPALTTRAIPTYTPVPTATAAPSAGISSGNGTFANGTTTNSSQPLCDGQIIPTDAPSKRGLPYPRGAKRGFALPWSSNGMQARDLAQNATSGNNTGACDALSLKYGVATGALQDASGDDDCSGACGACVPARCEVARVPAGASCDDLTHLHSTGAMNVTVYQLLSWNPSIIGLCDSLQEGQYICTGPPGGAYKPISSPLGNITAANETAHSGPGGSPAGAAAGAGSSASSKEASSTAGGSSPSASPTASPTSSASTSPSGSSSKSGSPAAPSPIQSGIAASCKRYAQSKAGDNCVDFAKANGATPETLYALNPVLGTAAASTCDKNFFKGYFYCVEG